MKIFLIAIVVSLALGCDPGYYFKEGTRRGGSCVICDYGTYKADSSDRTSCDGCPAGFTTPTQGSTASSSCIPICDVGWKRSGNTCVKCGYGFYNLKKDTSTTCTACPDGTGTRTETSQSSFDCHLDCGAGKESVDITDTIRLCSSCDKNFYKPDSGYGLCFPCPEFSVTVGRGSKSLSDCIEQKVCDAGYFRTSTEECEICNSGTINAAKDTSTSCTQCESGFDSWPKPAGTQCLEKCDSGHYLNLDYIEPPKEEVDFFSSGRRGIMKCVPCPIGQYNSFAGLQIECQSCNEAETGKSTEQEGSIYCDKVVFCKENYYLETRFVGASSTKIESCKSCPKGTGKVGNNRGNSCNTIIVEDLNCPAGEYSRWKLQITSQEKECAGCDQGYYKSGNGPGPCIKCPEGLSSTRYSEKKSLSDCIPPINCPKGQKRTSEWDKCTSCEKNTYSDTISPDQDCKACPSGTQTSGTGKTSSSDCILVCSAGHYLSNPSTCTQCPKGSYTLTSNSYSSCTACSTGKNTDGVGQSSCTLVDWCPSNEYLETRYVGASDKKIEDCKTCPTGEKKDGNNRLTSCTVFDDDDYDEYYDDDDEYYDDDEYEYF